MFPFAPYSQSRITTMEALWRQVAKLCTKKAVFVDGKWDNEFMKFLAYKYGPIVHATEHGMVLRWSEDVYAKSEKRSGFRQEFMSRDFWDRMEAKGAFKPGDDKKAFLGKMIEAIDKYIRDIPAGCNEKFCYYEC